MKINFNIRFILDVLKKALLGIKKKCLFLSEEEIEDTRSVIKIPNSKKDRQHNGQKEKNGSNNDLQNITHKTKDRVI